MVSGDGGCEKTLVKTECECIQLLRISKDLVRHFNLAYSYPNSYYTKQKENYSLEIVDYE